MSLFKRLNISMLTLRLSLILIVLQIISVVVIWIVVSNQLVTELQTIPLIVAVFLVLILLTVITVFFFIKREVAGPIDKISLWIEQFNSGNESPEVDLAATGQLAPLALLFRQTVNQMHQQLKMQQEASREMAKIEQEVRLYLEKTIYNYQAFINRVAEGDLTARLSPDDEGVNDGLVTLGHNLNKMVSSLAKMTGQIREAATNIITAAAEIAAATTQQASGVDQQSSAMAQVTTTIDEVKAIVEQSFQKAQSVAKEAQQTRDVSLEGQEAVFNAASGMEEIKAQVIGIAENITALSKQTQQIGEITTSVNEIASQSNLLALNASVEAARSGEHGKGFAVVAVEMRNLAKQSKQATAQVNDILNEIQKATQTAVLATEQGTQRVDVGAKLTRKTGETIQQLARGITKNADAARQIVASSQQQSTGMEQIAMAMENIHQATVQHMSSTQQTKKSAENLSTIARQMEQLVAEYKLD